MSEHPSEHIHEDRARALSFGGVAALYDRARPSYPSELIDALVDLSPRRALDVGCGTGKAARLLVERGCDVLGVEPDPSMAAIARSHGITVEDATFENWDARGRVFDLIVSGQAWHWVDPVEGVAKAGSLLRPGGHLGVFWNRGRPEDETRRALEAVYLRLAPELAKTNVALNLPAEPDGSDDAEFEDSWSVHRCRGAHVPLGDGLRPCRRGSTSSPRTAITSAYPTCSGVRSSRPSAMQSTRSGAR